MKGVGEWTWDQMGKWLAVHILCFSLITFVLICNSHTVVFCRLQFKYPLYEDAPTLATMSQRHVGYCVHLTNGTYPHCRVFIIWCLMNLTEKLSLPTFFVWFQRGGAKKKVTIRFIYIYIKAGLLYISEAQVRLLLTRLRSFLFVVRSLFC